LWLIPETSFIKTFSAAGKQRIALTFNQLLLCINQMCFSAVDQLLVRLSEAVNFPEHLKHPPVQDYHNSESRFQKKVNHILHCRKQSAHKAISFEEFTWKYCEVGHLTGNQLLRALVALSRNREALSPGTALVLTLNGEEEAAFIMFTDTFIEVETPSQERHHMRKYYRKLFDERHCKNAERNPE